MDNEYENVQRILKENYYLIYKVLKRYIDMDERYYDIVTLWIMGTYFHEHFITYPYLFFNATKGSGKTRMLKLIAALSYNGKLLVSLSEAVLFRTAKEGTICIDEFESIGRKEKQALRELLNAAYKKGLYVERAEKDKTGNWVIRKYDVFCPIAMANIWGMEDVLEDRCITIILEKSADPVKTRLLETFDEDRDIQRIKANFQLMQTFSVVLACRCLKKIYRDYNAFITINYNSTKQHNDTTEEYHDILHTFSPIMTLNDTLVDEKDEIFDNVVLEDAKKFLAMVAQVKFNSRPLELFFPLFFMAFSYEKEDSLAVTIKIAKEIIQEKQEEEFIESRDIMFIDFLARQSSNEDYKNFISIRKITSDFKDFVAEDEEEDEAKWINTKWVGRALKRLGVILEKRRKNKGREIIVDMEKAIQKLKVYKPFEPIEPMPIKTPETVLESQENQIEYETIKEVENEAN